MSEDEFADSRYNDLKDCTVIRGPYVFFSLKSDDARTFHFPVLHTIEGNLEFYVMDGDSVPPAIMPKIQMPSLRTIGGHFGQHNDCSEEHMSAIRQSFQAQDEITTIEQPINFPRLETVGGDFNVVHVETDTIELPALRSVGGYFLIENSSSQSLTFQKLEAVGRYVQFHNNDGLQDLLLPNLKTVQTVTIWSNKNLTTMNFQNLTSVRRALCVRKCPGLDHIRFPNLSSVGYLNLINNSGLQWVSFPKLQKRIQQTD